MTLTKSDPDKYFFNKKGDELAQDLMEKVYAFQDYAVRSGTYTQWRKNQKFYENRMFGSLSSDIIDVGAVGELKALTYNHFRNVIRHMLNQLTAITPSFDVSATNTEVASRRASAIGKDIVNYYFKVKRSTNKSKRAAENALVHGDGFVLAEWNPSIGRDIRPDDSDRMMTEGDFDIFTRSVYNFFYDYTLEDKADWPWIIYRVRENKFDLAEIFPKHKKRIKGLQNYYSTDRYRNEGDDIDDYELDSDHIFKYVAYHRKTPAVPNGKHIIFLGEEEAAFSIYEGESLYGKELPYFSVSPAEYIDSCVGFTEASIIRAPQEVINNVISSLVTNATAAGANNIWAPAGSNLNVQEVVDGMNLITTASDKKPEVISFYKDLPGLKDLMQMSISTIETLSGQNSAVRGNVKDTPNLKSGVAIATVINMAQQYSQALEKSYLEMFEDLATFLLKTLQKVATTERIIDIVGKMKATSVQSYTGDDLKGISRVIIDQTNPISKQPAGKIEIGMELLKLGVITPEKFFDVVNTGNLDTAVEADEKMLDFIAAAKEKLLEGEPIPPIPGINHQLYIKEIHSLLYDIEVIGNEENKGLMTNIIQTIQQQLEILRNGDEIASLIYGGKPPTPQEPTSQEVPPPQGGPPGPGQRPPGALRGLPSQNQDPNRPPPAKQPMQKPRGMP
jgi:hypothetical protein